MLFSSGSSYRHSCYTNTCATHSASTPSWFWAWVPCSPEAIVSTTSPQTHPSVVRCQLNNADTDLEIKCVHLMWSSPHPLPLLSLGCLMLLMTCMSVVHFICECMRSDDSGQPLAVEPYVTSGVCETVCQPDVKHKPQKC